MNEKTIKLCGKDVKIRYCAASETLYEKLAQKSISELQTTSQEDIMRLAICCVIAAYEREGKEVPIEAKDLLYEAKSSELINLYKAVFELRAQWYDVSTVVQPELEEEKKEEDKKN